jgi:2,5-furandicarboxylate decarboxylase 1
MKPLDTRFRSVLQRMDAAERILKVRQPVDIEYEIAGLMKRYDGDLALLFENVQGYSHPVIGNLLASRANCETAFGLDYKQIRDCMQRAVAEPIPPCQTRDRPACQDTIFTDQQSIDLGRCLPVLTHAPGDAGRFITAGVVIVKDPESGVHNASYHRLQLVGPSRTAIKLDAGRHLRTAFERAQQRGRNLPIAVCLGTDMALMYAAAFMGSQMPLDMDELSAAGGLKGTPLELAACRTQPLSVPADTEIVIEGEISVHESVHEGPFGEFVGYHSDAGPSPIVRVTALTHRHQPVYHAINGAGRETVMLRKYVMEASALRALRAAVPIVQDVEMTAGGLHRFHIVIQVRKDRPQDEGLQRNAMLAAFAALKDLDQAIVVDHDIDIQDPLDVEYALATRMEASRDLILIPGARGHEYVRVSDGGIRTKLAIDATVPFGDLDRFRRVEFRDVALDTTQTTTAPGAFANQTGATLGDQH